MTQNGLQNEHNNQSEPRAGLFNKVMLRIQKEEKIIASRRRFFVFLGIFITSAVSLVPSFLSMRAGFTETGFIKFFSLIFSDTTIVLSYWQNFALTLLESLPIVSIVLFVAVLTIFLGSIKFVARDMSAIFVLKNKLSK